MTISIFFLSSETLPLDPALLVCLPSCIYPFTLQIALLSLSHCCPSPQPKAPTNNVEVNGRLITALLNSGSTVTLAWPAILARTIEPVCVNGTTQV